VKTVTIFDYIKKSQESTDLNDNKFVFRWDFVFEEEDKIEKSSYKYLRKEWKNNKWEYIYEEPNKKISRDNKIYKLSPNRAVIIKPYKTEGNRDYYNQFVDNPEEAIRFIVSKYEKEPQNAKRKTICENVLWTNIIENGIIKRVSVNLSHENTKSSGIVHAVEDHYQKQDDFNSPKEMSDKIREILENIDTWSNAQVRASDTKRKDKDGWSLLLTEDKSYNDGEKHYFIRTVIDYNRREEDKIRTPELTRESFIEKSEKNFKDVFPLNVDSHSRTSSQFSGKDTTSLSNMQQNIEKSERMNIFQFLKSKTNKREECIIKGVSYYQVENGWIPNYVNSTGLLLVSNDILEKGRRCA